MPKQVALPVAGQPKKFPLRLTDELASDLYVYCEVTGAFHTKVICKAVRRYIDEELRANDGIRSDFAREKAKLSVSTRESHPADVLRLMPTIPGGVDTTNRGSKQSKRNRTKKS